MVRLSIIAPLAALAFSAVCSASSHRDSRRVHHRHSSPALRNDLASTDDVATPHLVARGTAGSSAALLPLHPKKGWTVSPSASADNVNKIALTNTTFIMEKDIKGLPHPVIKDPQDGLPTIHAHFEKGAYELRPDPPGGFSFYTRGPPSNSGTGPKLDMTKATEISFAFSVKFSAGYDYHLGGKLPGLYGGITEDIAETCSGGNHPDGCFSTRFMFRTAGQGELYLYIPPSQNRADLCGPTGTAYCPPAPDGLNYGAEVGTGSWNFTTGAYTTVRQVIHLNTPGMRDGWAKVYVNGSPTAAVAIFDISFRNSSQAVFWGLQMQTFHGGHEAYWAPDHAQDSYFRDFSIAITQ